MEKKERLKKNVKQKKNGKSKKSSTAQSSSKFTMEGVNLDLLEMAEVVDSLNERLFNAEKNLGEINNFLNVMSNTVNYALATAFVYEQYFVDMGADRKDLQREIDEVYFDAFTKTKNNQLDDYKKSIIKQINDKIRQFQEKLNSNG